MCGTEKSRSLQIHQTAVSGFSDADSQVVPSGKIFQLANGKRIGRCKHRTVTCGNFMGPLPALAYVRRNRTALRERRDIVPRFNLFYARPRFPEPISRRMKKYGQF